MSDMENMAAFIGTLNGEDRVMKAQHVRVRLDAARAVEFKIRFHVFNPPKSL